MTAKEDLRSQRISVIIHSAAAIALGIITNFIGIPLYAFGLVIVMGVVIKRLTEKIVGEQKFTWWIGNGFFIYVLVWADMCIFIANYF